VFKTVHLQHGGKLSLARLLVGIWRTGRRCSPPPAKPDASGILASCAHDSKRAVDGGRDTVALGNWRPIKTRRRSRTRQDPGDQIIRHAVLGDVARRHRSGRRRQARSGALLR